MSKYGKFFEKQSNGENLLKIHIKLFKNFEFEVKLLKKKTEKK